MKDRICPPSFTSFLIEIGFEDFFVACDQNQQITDNNSSRQEIQDCLGLGLFKSDRTVVQPSQLLSCGEVGKGILHGRSS